MQLVFVDGTRKATISVGGSCKLRCRHCYITAPQFRFQPHHSVQSIIESLETKRGTFDAICISGDTDPLLDESEFRQLLSECAEHFPDCHLMFTTRLLPSDGTLEEIDRTGKRVMETGRLFVPAVSIITHQFPNALEDADRVPSSAARIALISTLSKLGFPVLAALRPTLPFEVVPRAEVEALVNTLASSCAAILGEVFIVDKNDVISERLGLPKGKEPLEYMTFLEQPGLWRKRRFQAEIDFVRTTAHSHNVPFFLRSMSAVRFLEWNWDRANTCLASSNLGYPGIFDEQNP